MNLISYWRRRNQKLASNDRGFKDLLSRLLQLRPQSIIVAWSGQDDFAGIAEYGKRFPAYRAVLCLGEPSNCHTNASRLFSAGVIDFVCTGYAYTAKDRMWRNHTWGLRDGRVIETTVRRQSYFGITYNLEGSRLFCEAQGVKGWGSGGKARRHPDAVR
jgi:hypothetical protein